MIAPRGWNYCDWVPEWPGGWPPAARDGASALINLVFVYALQHAADMHAPFGENLLAWHWRSLAALRFCQNSRGIYKVGHHSGLEWRRLQSRYRESQATE